MTVFQRKETKNESSPQKTALCFRFIPTKYSSHEIRNVKDQSLGLFPPKAGIRDRFSVAAIPDLLCAVLDVAFDHKSLEKCVDRA